MSKPTERQQKQSPEYIEMPPSDANLSDRQSVSDLAQRVSVPFDLTNVTTGLNMAELPQRLHLDGERKD